MLLFMLSCETKSTQTSAPTANPSLTTATTATPAKNPTQTVTQTPTTAPQYGGILKIIMPPGITNMGYPGKPWTGYSNLCSRPAVEYLIGADPAGSGKPVPLLATKWEISPDYKSITFTLRQGVKFHDGTNFDAEAAKFNFELVKASDRTELKSVTSIDVIDKYTMRLNLSAYEPQLLTTLIGPPTYIVSPTSIQKSGDENLLHPVGTGPFKFASYQTDVSLKYERFDDYWGGKPYLDGIEWDFIKDPMTSLMSFKNGDAQVLTYGSGKDAYDLKSTGKYDVTTSWLGSEGLIGDSGHSESPFSNIKVRQATAYAINRENIAKMLGYGFYLVANQLAPSTNWNYNPAVIGYPYNTDKAKQLLAAAGYPNGFDTKITFDSTKADYKSMFTVVQENLKQVGINVKLDAVDPARLSQTITGGWSDGMVHYRVPCSPEMDPGQALGSSLSSWANRYSPKSMYIPADYEAKLTQAITEPDFEKRKPLFQELMKIITDQYCLADAIYITSSLAIIDKSTVHNFDLWQYSAKDYHLEKTWLSKK
jgi:peptide/nickel transport system substrate-binding protein